MDDRQIRSKKNNGIVMVIIAIIIAATVGFYGGVQYQKSQQNFAAFGMQNGKFPSGYGQSGNGRPMGPPPAGQGQDIPSDQQLPGGTN
jgi:hypothetical protein